MQQGREGTEERALRDKRQRLCGYEHKSVMNSDLGLDFVGIPAGELLLTGGRDEDVARGLQEAALIGRGAGEAHNGAMLL